jgi:hypothetical protein
MGSATARRYDQLLDQLLHQDAVLQSGRTVFSDTSRNVMCRQALCMRTQLPPASSSLTRQPPCLQDKWDRGYDDQPCRLSCSIDAFDPQLHNSPRPERHEASSKPELGIVKQATAVELC